MKEAEVQKAHDRSIIGLEIETLRNRVKDAECKCCRLENENKVLVDEMAKRQESYRIQLAKIIAGKPRPWKALAAAALCCTGLALLAGLCVHHNLMAVQLGEQIALSALVACSVLSGVSIERAYWNQRWETESKRGAWK